MLLRDKNAVIYGGAGAIGGAVARDFARGARASSPGRTLATLELVAKEISEADGKAGTAEIDAVDERAVEEGGAT